MLKCCAHMLICAYTTHVFRRRPDYEIRDYEPAAVQEAFREGQTEIPPSGEFKNTAGA